MQSITVPYWRLSALYASYFAVVGMVMPYFGLFLNERGLTGQEIGWVMSAMFLARIIGPNFWAWCSDKTGQRLRWVQLGALLSLVTFSGIYWAQGLSLLLVVIVLFGFFWNAILAQMEVLTLGYLAQKPETYGNVRLWGSVGFVIAVAGLGIWFESFSTTTLPTWVVLGALAIFISSISLPPEVNRPSKSSLASFKRQLLSWPVVGFFIAQILLQMSHGPYYTFFSLYLQDFDYSSTMVGFFWALGVVVEVGFFMIAHHLIRHYSVNRLMMIALLLTVIRWLLIATCAQWLPVLLLAQALHAASFAATHAAAIEWLRQNFSSSLQGQGQALYSAAAYGVGGAVGAALSGWLWEMDHSAVFLMAALAAFLSFVITWASNQMKV